MGKQEKQYLVRKVVEYKKGQYRVYLKGEFFKSYITKDPNIKKYSIVVIRNDKVFKAIF